MVIGAVGGGLAGLGRGMVALTRRMDGKDVVVLQRLALGVLLVELCDERYSIHSGD